MCAEVFAVMCADMCVDRCADICADVCADMCADMWVHVSWACGKGTVRLDCVYETKSNGSVVRLAACFSIWLWLYIYGSLYVLYVSL